MYIRTRARSGQDINFAETPDPEALRAQQELMERRRKLLEQGEQESRQRNLELLEKGDFERSVNTIRRELQRLPGGAFVKGSAERLRLENAFKSIPSSRAHAFLTQLLNPKDPLGRLFHHRLATATRNALFLLLCRKIVPSPSQCSKFETEGSALPTKEKVVPKKATTTCAPYVWRESPRYPNKKVFCEFLPGASAPPFDCKYQCYP